MANNRALRGTLNPEANNTPTNDFTGDRGTKANPIVINDDADALGKQKGQCRIILPGIRSL